MNFNGTVPIMSFINIFTQTPVVILIIVEIIFGIFTSIIAEQKGYRLFIQLLVGFLFGPIALLAVIGLPDNSLKELIQELIQINKNNIDFVSEDSRQREKNRIFLENLEADNLSALDLKEYTEKDSISNS